MTRDAGRRCADATRIGVYVCHCGGNISDYVDVEHVVEAVKDEPGVVVARDTHVRLLRRDPAGHGADIEGASSTASSSRPARPSCTPFTFRGVAKRAGLNPYQYTQVNIREQDSWAHTRRPRQGPPHKAISLVKGRHRPHPADRAARADRRRDHAEDAGRSAAASPVCGRRSAWPTSASASSSSSAKRSSAAGSARFGDDVPARPRRPRADREPGRRRSARRPDITVFTDAELVSKSGSFGNYRRGIRVGGETCRRRSRSRSARSSWRPASTRYQPEEGEFGYGIDGVVTLPEFKELIDDGDGTRSQYHGRPVRTRRLRLLRGQPRSRAANEYCSRYCCAATVHASHRRSSTLDPTIHQYHLYRDIRTYGKYELVYTESRKRGSVYMKFPDDDAAGGRARRRGGLTVTMRDRSPAARSSTIPADLVVLVTGMVPRENEELVERPQAPARTRRLLQRDPPEAAAGRDRRRRRPHRRRLPGPQELGRERGLRPGRRDPERGDPQEGLRRARPARRDRQRRRVHRVRRVPDGLPVRRDRQGRRSTARRWPSSARPAARAAAAACRSAPRTPSTCAATPTRRSGR